MRSTAFGKTAWGGVAATLFVLVACSSSSSTTTTTTCVSAEACFSVAVAVDPNAPDSCKASPITTTFDWRKAFNANGLFTNDEGCNGFANGDCGLDVSCPDLSLVLPVNEAYEMKIAFTENGFTGVVKPRSGLCQLTLTGRITNDCSVAARDAGKASNNGLECGGSSECTSGCCAVVGGKYICQPLREPSGADVQACLCAQNSDCSAITVCNNAPSQCEADVGVGRVCSRTCG